MNKAVFALIALFALAVSPHSKENEPNQARDLFLSNQSVHLREYEAFRHMEASNSRANVTGFIEVETKLESDNLLTYRITKEEGSEYIRNKVLRRFLEDEKKQVRDYNFKKSAFTRENYDFPTAENVGDVLKLTISPRKKEAFLINGFLLIKPDGELLSSEGKLVKNPSFWTRDVSVSVNYGLIAGVRVPTSYQFIARVLFAGKSYLSTKYEYTSVNGTAVEKTR